jgi:hypothetical protein
VSKHDLYIVLNYSIFAIEDSPFCL